MNDYLINWPKYILTITVTKKRQQVENILLKIIEGPILSLIVLMHLCNPILWYSLSFSETFDALLSIVKTAKVTF